LKTNQDKSINFKSLSNFNVYITLAIDWYFWDESSLEIYSQRANILTKSFIKSHLSALNIRLGLMSSPRIAFIWNFKSNMLLIIRDWVFHRVYLIFLFIVLI
jgi:hypothetical protein